MPRPPVNAPLRDLGPWMPPSPSRLAATIAGVALVAALVAAFAGWWAGGAAGVDEPAVAPAAPVAVSLGSMRVLAPTRWTPDEATEAARLDARRTAVFAVDPALSARAIVTLAPVEDPSLIPAGLRASLTGAPGAARAASLAGRPAWRYDGLKLHDGDRLDLTLLPTTAGVLAVGCARPTDEPASACTEDTPQFDLGTAAAVAPAADLALKQRLPAAIGRLDARRVPLRRSLAAASTRRGQARFADRLARVYARTAGGLAPVAPGRSSVVGSMRRAGAAYAALSRAASRGRRGGFARARARVKEAERALGLALGASG